MLSIMQVMQKYKKMMFVQFHRYWGKRIGHCMRSNQPIAGIFLRDRVNRMEKEGGKRLFRMGQGDTKISMILYIIAVLELHFGDEL